MMEDLHSKVVGTLDGLIGAPNKAYQLYSLIKDIECQPGASDALKVLSVKLRIILVTLGACGKCTKVMNEVPMRDGFISMDTEYTYKLRAAHMDIVSAMDNVLKIMPNASMVLQQSSLMIMDEICTRSSSIPFDGRHGTIMDMVGRNLIVCVHHIAKEYKESSL